MVEVASCLADSNRNHFLLRIELKEFPCMSKIVKLCFVSLLVLAMSAVAFAQSTTTGSIGGVVTNPNKEVVPGAAVTVKNIGTNKEDSATTDDTGRLDRKSTSLNSSH